VNLGLLDFSGLTWVGLLFSGLCVGLGKGGLGGIGLIPIFIFAEIFSPRESTGMLLLCLLLGDGMGLVYFRQHADWRQLRRLVLPAFLGILLGWWTLGWLTNEALRPLLGWIILCLTAAQLLRKPIGATMEHAYRSPVFAFLLGSLGGWTTMIANAAGPVMSLFFLAMNLRKLAFIGTATVFFLTVNLVKLPFSWQLGLLTEQTFYVVLSLSPFIVAGFYLGRWTLLRLSQSWFERLILLFAVAGALRLILY
jgi:uncharacterized protein